MRVLGVSAFYYDRAAELIDDGVIIAAAQEERFSRRKHDSRFPVHALSYCLNQGGIGLDCVDQVVFYDKPFFKFERLVETYLAFAPHGFKSFRMSVNKVSSRPQPAKSLGGGGLYRRDAIVACGGYAGNRNLKAWEEAELGRRLIAGGWSLERIGVPAVRHTGHSLSTWALLRSLWRSKRAMANGVLLKETIAYPWRGTALTVMLQPLLVLLMWAGMGTLLVVGVTISWDALAIYFVGILCAVGAFAALKRSLTHALTSFALWHFHAAGIVMGVFAPTVSAREPIDSVRLNTVQGS